MIPTRIKTDIKMSADDIKLQKKILQKSDGRELQEDLVHHQEWSKKWLLKFNLDKCTVMHVWHSIATQYTMEQDDQSSSLTEVTEEKDLGVSMSSNLKVSRQCTKTIRKASNILRLIKRHFFILVFSALTPLVGRQERHPAQKLLLQNPLGYCHGS